MKKSNLACAAAAACLCMGSAQADTLSVDYDYLGPTFDVVALLASPFQVITASPFLVSNLTAANSFVAFCIEPFVPLSVSAISLAGNATYSSATPYSVAAVQALYNGFYGNALSSGSEAAAFQFALWEIVTETIAGPFNITAGNFAFSGVQGPPATPVTATTAVARAQQMLDGVGAASDVYALSAYTTTFAGGDRSQNLLTATLVPEPGTYAMMLAGLALLGGVVRRRKA